MRAILLLSLAALSAIPAAAQGSTVKVILRGKVKMDDGSPPPKSVGLERVCSDRNGNKPGPITDKNGVYTWTMDVNPMNTRTCYIHATLKDFTSSRIDISGLSGFIDINITMEDLVLSPLVPDPASLDISDSGVPGAAKDAWKKASSAVQSGNLNESAAQYKQVAEKAPKFARGWLNLGIVQLAMAQGTDAKASFEQAVAADPRSIAGYVMLARVQIKAADWAGAAKTAADGIAADKKREYAELYVHHATALYEQKDLAGAEASALKAFDPKERLKAVRGELVLAKIYEAKGDLAKAKEHALHYLQVAPTAPDKETIKLYVEKIGQPDAPRFDLDVF